MKEIKIIAAGLLLGLSCTLGAQTRHTAATRGSSAIAESAQGKDLSISGTDITKTVRMDGGNLHISGTDCTITVLGSAATISIQGTDVNVDADRVNTIQIVGTDSHVRYRSSGNKGGKPAVSITGTGCSVARK